MSSGIGLFLIIFLAISGMIVLISKFKWHPFIVLILSALFVGLTTGMGINDLIAKITTWFKCDKTNFLLIPEERHYLQEFAVLRWRLAKAKTM